MHPDLQRLIRLQEIELQIKYCTEQIEQLPRKMEELESKLNGTLQRLRSSKDRQTKLASEKRKLEGSIQDLEQKISKYKGQLIDVKTNDQYRSLLNEIEFGNNQIRKIEDEILLNMEEEEKLRKEIAQAEQQLATEQVDVNVEKKTVEAEVEQDRKLLVTAEEDRRRLVELLDPTLFERYCRIASIRKGVALARAAEESCQACHVRIRPHLLSQVMSGETIVACDSCDRILYWKPDIPYEVPA
jgi:predicted  nucleic acid-binding Zn-ribbon protein